METKKGNHLKFPPMHNLSVYLTGNRHYYQIGIASIFYLSRFTISLNISNVCSLCEYVPICVVWCDSVSVDCYFCACQCFHCCSCLSLSFQKHNSTTLVAYYSVSKENCLTRSLILVVFSL